MIVKELIELLQKIPQESEVVVNDDEGRAPDPHVYEFYGAVWVML